MAFKTIRAEKPTPASIEDLRKLSERGFSPLRGVKKLTVEFTKQGNNKVPFVVISEYENDGDKGQFAEVKTSAGWIALRSFISKNLTDHRNPNDIQVVQAEGLCPVETPLDKVYDAIAEKGENYEFSVVTTSYMAKSSKNGNIFNANARTLK